MNKNLNPFPNYLACMKLIKAAQMFFLRGNRGQMRLAKTKRCLQSPEMKQLILLVGEQE